MSNDNKPISIQNSPLTREGYKIFGRSDRERKHNGQFGDIVRLKRATSAIIYGNDFTRRFIASDSGKMAIVDTKSGSVASVIVIDRNGYVKQVRYSRIYDKKMPVSLSEQQIGDYGGYIQSIADKVLPIAAKMIKPVDHYDDADADVDPDPAPDVDPARSNNSSAVQEVRDWFAKLNPPPSPSG